MIDGQHNLKPHKPEIITSEIELISFHYKMVPDVIIKGLIEGD